MVGVKPVGSDPDFQPELSGAGSRLAVVKFTMRGCGPCLRIAPAFNSMSNKYPQAVFLEVDVHQCQGTAATNNISATPTFLFFRNKVRIDQYQGADAVGLEEKIKQHLENDPGSNEDTDIPKGYMDLMPFINKAGCECLNESDDHGFDNCLRKDTTFLESDCDEQLLITVAFNQPVKLYSMKFQGPDNGQGPKYVKIFINLPRSMDFEEAERSEPTQALELTEDDIKEDGIVPLRYVKFQNVNSVTIFVQSNQGEEETTRISYFTFIGTPVQATNMNDFKRRLSALTLPMFSPLLVQDFYSFHHLDQPSCTSISSTISFFISCSSMFFSWPFGFCFGLATKCFNFITILCCSPYFCFFTFSHLVLYYILRNNAVKHALL
ncbi:thioredoxin-like protein 1 isoform X1 [Manis javanica]|uniref:thioredoxin-like protein 1 isoform X1 n=2 Tax=Manis javanica TaxID=9974 RepID=UPI00187A12D4|nr:thioredoxin-like protein 1 isoform X1 [Manis javanica]